MKTIITLTCILAAVCSFGQFKMNQQNWATPANGAYKYKAVRQTGVAFATVGIAGVSQTYDMTSLNYNDSMMVSLMSSNGFYNTAKHPNSNVYGLMDMGPGGHDPGSPDSIWDFYKSTSSSFVKNSIGVRMPAGMGGMYLAQDYQLGVDTQAADYMTYGSSGSFQYGFYAIVITDTFHYEVTQKTYTFDGWGTLKTWKGTYNVLRMKVEEYGTNVDKDSLGNPKTKVDTNNAYYFYAQGVSGALAIAHMSPYFDQVWEIMVQDVAVPNAIASAGFPQFDLYPNPTCNILNIQSSGRLIVSVSDVRGRVIISNTLLTNNNLDVSSLCPGIYFVSATDKTTGSVSVRKFVKE